MRSGVKRFVWGALVAFVLSFVVAGSVEAQSAVAGTPGTSNTTLKLDYASAVQPLVSRGAPMGRTRTSFLRQGGAADEDSGIGFGVLGMITRTSVDVDDDLIDVNARTGWGVGAWVGGNRNGRVGFVGEFIYAVRNVQDEDDENVEFRVFEIPAVFHVNFGSRSRNSIGGYVVVGPVFTFNLGQSIDGDELEDEDKFKGADIGIIGGAGVEIFRIGIEGRGNWGLRSISNEGDVLKIKTFTFELLGKFAFN
jgi:hypothetical protein